MVADFADRQDFDNANRGLLGRWEPRSVVGSDGRIVYDADRLAEATTGDRPETVHPSLWRQAQLTAIQGLFEVTDGIYQVRGLDISNMTLVEGRSGVIVIDPLVSAETAAAALELYRQHRGERAVSAVVYTHPHLDHFGGVLGVVDADTDVPIVAPAGFLEHAVSENVYAGTAMMRRAIYQTGMGLPSGGTGTYGTGLGSSGSAGTAGLIAPTLHVTHTGQEETLDGVRIVFQLTPGTEAPAEMNFHFPERRALCVSENASHTMHNILTPRGAQIRDARMWARYLAETIELFGAETDVAFASHHWPTWGTEEVQTYLREQRDLYAFMHDQTLRRMNQGYVAGEIAEMVKLPAALEARWHTHGYYGTLNHNLKAIYQFYLGWWDGNPAHYWQHPPEEAGARYAEAFGGVDALVEAARGFAERGDLRFAAELASHAVFADRNDQAAAEVLSEVLTRLGYGSEAATWRNIFLTGARELSHPPQPMPMSASGIVAALSITQLFDTLAIRIDGERAGVVSASILWRFTDAGEDYRMELSHGALIHHPTTRHDAADLQITLTRADLPGLLGGDLPPSVRLDGDPHVLSDLLDLTDQPDTAFRIVSP